MLVVTLKVDDVAQAGQTQCTRPNETRQLRFDLPANNFVQRLIRDRACCKRVPGNGPLLCKSSVEIEFPLFKTRKDNLNQNSLTQRFGTFSIL